MYVKRIFAIIVVIFIIMACMPISAFAVDPVSTATMANALAQAITAYGASQGASITFDVATTDGIGEGMHELWNNFKTYINDNNVPTYDSLAMTMWATIYTKIGNFIGININDTEMPYIDAFWNWLLTGPAEMTKVDNEYYQWTVDSQTGNVSPVPIFHSLTTTINGYDVHYLPVQYTSSSYFDSPYDDVFEFSAVRSNGQYGVIYFASFSPNRTYAQYQQGQPNPTQQNISSSETVGGITLYFGYQTWNPSSGNYVLTPDFINSLAYSDLRYPLSNLFRVNANNNTVVTDQNNISVQPYIGDTVPQDVYIPDNEDVNYTPLPYVGGLDIPWDDSLFGDGNGSLTDAQSEAISEVIDSSITDSLEKTLTLADAENPDIPASEVYIPFLPVALPNFNFSLSGIWHYVREWIASLGAWFTMVLTVWNNLPYAMVVPVYATMVVLIVLGVYKRFFM